MSEKMKKVSTNVLSNRASLHLPPRSSPFLCQCLTGTFVPPSSYKNLRVVEKTFFSQLSKLIPPSEKLVIPDTTLQVNEDTVKLPTHVLKELVSRLQSQHNLLLQIKDFVNSHVESFPLEEKDDYALKTPGNVKKVMEKIINDNMRKNRLIEYLRRERLTLIQRSCKLSKEIKIQKDSRFKLFMQPTNIVSNVQQVPTTTRYYKQLPPMDYEIPSQLTSNGLNKSDLNRLYESPEHTNKAISVYYICHISFKNFTNHFSVESRFHTAKPPTEFYLSKASSLIIPNNGLKAFQKQNSVFSLNIKRKDLQKTEALLLTAINASMRKKSNLISIVEQHQRKFKQANTIIASNNRKIAYTSVIVNAVTIQPQLNLSICQDLGLSIIPRIEYTTLINFKRNGCLTHQLSTSHLCPTKNYQFHTDRTDSTLCSSRTANDFFNTL